LDANLATTYGAAKLDANALRLDVHGAYATEYVFGFSNSIMQQVDAANVAVVTFCSQR
jgi:hypothetical protein